MAAKNYCFVDNGVIKEGPGALPQNWKYGNINKTNMQHLNDEELVAIGWLLHEEVPAVYDEATHYRNGYDIDIQETKVVYTNILVAFTADEIKNNKWNKWKSEMYWSDRDGLAINRPTEDVLDMLIDKYPTILSDFDPDGEGIKKRYDDKKETRSRIPPKP
jgi:hypothetical protein